jgi:hypothetical protein
MKTLITILLLLCLMGCGDGQVLVDKRIVDWNTLQTMSDGDGSISGHADWKEKADGRECTIFMLPDDFYSQDDYFKVQGHELEHCFKGNFHD